jgi:hypothetical protein
MSKVLFLWDRCRTCNKFYFDHVECNIGLGPKSAYDEFVPKDNLKYLEYKYEESNKVS